MDSKPYSEAVCAMIDLLRMHKALASEKIESLYPHRTAHMMLMYLSRKDVCSSQKELAEHFHITPAAVTGILKKLENDGYIERKAAIDLRNNMISITDRGLHMVASSRELFGEVDELLFCGFTMEEIENLICMINRMKDNIKKSQEGEENI